MDDDDDDGKYLQSEKIYKCSISLFGQNKLNIEMLFVVHYAPVICLKIGQK